MKHNMHNWSQDASTQEKMPVQMDVKIHTLRTDGPVLANASVTLNGCFAIRGIKVMNGSNGLFVSMPSYRTADGYKNICFPCTKEFHQQFNAVVVDAYRQTLAQLPQQREPGPERSESPLEQEEPPVPQMSM